MLFFPLKVDLHFNRYPVLTIAICLLCLVIFIKQQNSDEDLYRSAVIFCEKDNHERMFWVVMEKVTGKQSERLCADVLYDIHFSRSPESQISTLVDEADVFESRSETSSREFIQQMLEDKYQQFTTYTGGKSLSSLMMYDPYSYHLGTMISAAFAHGSWGHLLGNLFFFYAFAASIEMILGTLRYLIIVLTLAVGTHLAYSLSVMNISDALPTYGLSGVVMGMIGLFTYLMPKVNIRCFWWFFVIVKILRIPAWILAAWYISWDVYDLFFSSGHSSINFVAHVSGASIGLLLGVLFFSERKNEVQQELRLHQLHEQSAAEEQEH